MENDMVFQKKYLLKVGTNTMATKIFEQYSWDIIKQSILSEVWKNYKSFDELVNTLENRFHDFEWKTLIGWEEMEDSEILEHLTSLNSFKDKLIVITDVSYKFQYGPFGVAANNISSFANEFWSNFGECMFNGDTIIINDCEKIIWLFHHEGLYTSLKV